MVSYSSVGKILHAVNLLNIAIYGASLYVFGDDLSSAGIFDREWLHDGFCLPHGDQPFWTTHDLSGYILVAFALLGIWIQRSLPKQGFKGKRMCLERADRLTFWALIGAIGHAMGHFLISNGKRNAFYPEPNERFIDNLWKGSIWVGLGKAGPGYVLFWVPLVKTYMMNTAKNRVALLALLCYIGSLFVPSKFGFSYTQTVLFGGTSIDHLWLPMEEQDTFEFAFLAYFDDHTEWILCLD